MQGDLGMIMRAEQAFPFQPRFVRFDPISECSSGGFLLAPLSKAGGQLFRLGASRGRDVLEAKFHSLPALSLGERETCRIHDVAAREGRLDTIEGALAYMGLSPEECGVDGTDYAWAHPAPSAPRKSA